MSGKTPTNSSKMNPNPTLFSNTMASKKKTIEQLRAQIKQLQSKNIEEEIRCLELKNNADDLRVQMKKKYDQSEQQLRVQREKEKKLVKEIKSLEAASKVAHSKDNNNAKMGEYWKQFCE